MSFGNLLKLASALGVRASELLAHYEDLSAAMGQAAGSRRR